MKIDKKFNTLNLKEYSFYIDNYKKYIDFNSLGLYRSIVENENLTLEQKIEVREYAHKTFQKSFDFLQLKDPITFFEVSTLGQELTKADENQFWKNIKHNQQKILTDKKIKHRNFGTYSKHECGSELCNLRGMMVRQNSSIAETCINFDSDKNKNSTQQKSKRLQKEQRNFKTNTKL